MDDIAKEEYKQIFTMTSQLEQRMLQIFGLSLAVSVSIFSAIAVKIVMGSNESDLKILDIYLLLAPMLISIPAFSLLLAHRLDLARAAAYQKVFYESKSDYAGWVTRLNEYRKHSQSEGHDPMPLAYWSVSLLSSGMFLFFMISLSFSIAHLVVGIIPLLIMAKLQYSWSSVVKQEREKCVAIWEKVKQEHNK